MITLSVHRTVNHARQVVSVSCNNTYEIARAATDLGMPPALAVRLVDALTDGRRVCIAFEGEGFPQATCVHF